MPSSRTCPVRRCAFLGLASLGCTLCLPRPAAANALPPTALPTAGTDSIPRVASDSTVVFRVEIPQQPLAAALRELARQTGLRIELAAELGRDDTEALAPKVAGRMTVPGALRALLAGRRLRADFRHDRWIVGAAKGDSPGTVLQRVVITGGASRSGYLATRTRTATRTDTPLRDVPQSVTVVGRALIADQSMRGMGDVVRYVPGVTMGQGEGHRDAPTIRGISSTADFFVDGVRDDAQYQRDLYNVERVEALKGANALAFGRGGGGGAINRVSKEAQWSPRYAFTAAGGSYGERRATLDVGDALGRAVAVRLNGVHEESGSHRHDVRLARAGINPTATVLLGGEQATIVRLGLEYFRDRRTVDRGIPSFRGAPSEGGVRTFFGDPDASRAHAEVWAANVSMERALTEALTLRHRSRFARYDKSYRNVFPGAVDSSGNLVALSAYASATDRHNQFHQVDLAWDGRTGWLGHTLVAGGEVGWQATDNFRQTGYFDGTATSYAVPFARPTVSAPVTFRQSATDADNTTTANVAAIYVQDQLTLGDRWQAIAGVRYDRFALDYRNERNAQRLSRTDGMVSPRAGLVFRAAEPLSLYGSYGVSSLPASGDQFGSLTVTTRTLRPERFFNREVGAKWEPGSDVSVTAAIFRLDRTNTTAPSPSDPAVLVQTGRQRATGVELGVNGRLTNAWQVAGGFTSQQATIVSRTAAARAGATVPLVPHRTISLWNRYQVVRSFGVALGIVRQGPAYAAIDNSVTLPAFTRVDAAAYFVVSPWLRGQVNVENVFDREYYPTSHGNNNIMPGSPRAFRVTLSTAP